MLQITALFICLSFMENYGGILSLRLSALDQRIVGGIEVDICHHPYQVTLQYLGIHNCGGSIISKNWVITAAHCIGYDPENYTIRVGSKNKYRGKIYNISRIIIHPKYSTFNHDYDIGLLQIKRKFKFGFEVNSIELPEKELPHGEMVNVTGWGTLTDGGIDTDNLRRVTVPIVDRKLCTRAYKDVNFITERMICAGQLENGGKDSCQGDSGGPLSATDTLYGIVSWGFGCAKPNYPGVYTNVAYFRSWITNVTGI